MSRAYTFNQIEFSQKLNDLSSQINKNNNNLVYFIYKKIILKNYNSIKNEELQKEVSRKLKFDIDDFKSFKNYISQKIRDDINN